MGGVALRKNNNPYEKLKANLQCQQQHFFFFLCFFFSLCLFFIIDKRRVGPVILETYTNSSIESVFLPWKFQFDMWTFASIPGSARDKFMPSPFIIHHV